MLNAQVNGPYVPEGVKPMEHYLNNPHDVHPAQRGQWPVGQFTDKYEVTHKYGTKDDGTDDHTILNAQRTHPSDLPEGVKPMEHYLNNPHDVPQAKQGQWPVGQFKDQWGVVHRYGGKDDGTDDHTVLNAQREIAGVRMEHHKI